MHQIHFLLGLRPRPRWGSLQCPISLPLFKGPTSKGMEGNGIGEEKVKGKEGREGFGPPKKFGVAPPMYRSDHVRPALKELHWLPVVYRIKFKLALVMFTIHTHQCPDYLADFAHSYTATMIRQAIGSARRPAPTTLFHVRGRNLTTELSLWPGQSRGTVYQRQFVTRTVYTL